MAVCFSRDDRILYDETVALIDRHSVNERTFGVTQARTHPEFVFGIRGVSCLVHKVRHVTIHWYAFAGMNHLGRLKRPCMIAETMCAQSFRLNPEIARTCEIPSPDALLCGRCLGQGPTFPKRGRAYKSQLTRQEAHIKLGCVENGY